MRHRPLESASEPPRLPCHPAVPSCHSEVRRGIPTSARAARSTQIHFRTTPPPLSFRGPPRNLDFRSCGIVPSNPLQNHPASPAIPRSPPVIPRSAEESRLPLPRHRQLRSASEAPRLPCHPEVPRGIPTSGRAPSPAQSAHRTTPLAPVTFRDPRGNPTSEQPTPNAFPVVVYPSKPATAPPRLSSQGCPGACRRESRRHPPTAPAQLAYGPVPNRPLPGNHPQPTPFVASPFPVGAVREPPAFAPKPPAPAVRAEPPQSPSAARRACPEPVEANHPPRSPHASKPALLKSSVPARPVARKWPGQSPKRGLRR